MDLQRRASFQTRKGRCNTLNCCIILSLNRFRFKGIMQRFAAARNAGSLQSFLRCCSAGWSAACRRARRYGASR
ncbi:hypothetical protein ELI13_15350 [Rhizobium ruizarguesonis]|uniref:Uncharacterized protein n=1 Tax=Rhizobium ruizarguesonis TaxID=2081791 RepID=A0ABY1XBV4_9HYPH|nr:hypothetical protein [Rhizobium ruizarguesonis]NKL25352.1 hypothetical protein [Rhizobium leguminosarum bv. viciae]NEH76692.1 hypothetical protein [Rhizobium ruizarguesonis]NEH86108.1 hypothetical protein [Rhizobium ruizarguesonis]NEI14806.1 hypothetical protein [Rhizobium ruizarguesonis]